MSRTNSSICCGPIRSTGMCLTAGRLSTGLSEIDVADMGRDQMLDAAVHRELAELARARVRERADLRFPPVLDEGFREGAFVNRAGRHRATAA